jgi:hypothetical protein
MSEARKPKMRYDVVKSVDREGNLVLMTEKEKRAWRKATKTKIRNRGKRARTEQEGGEQ